MTRRQQAARPKIWNALAEAIGAAGSVRHVDRLIDLIGADVPHDLVTVTRYSAVGTPQFVKHRRFSDEMVRRYLESYYVFDPFYASWRRDRRLGVVPLRSLADGEAKRGQYIAGFLAQSAICDEVGVLLGDGGDRCLGIFLDRTTKPFRDGEIALLRERMPVFAALHASDLRTRSPGTGDLQAPSAPGAAPSREPTIPERLWPELSLRERALAELILAGHPNATIAQRLGIAVGTVKNHRANIYCKLDVTTERELFLQYFQHGA